MKELTKRQWDDVGYRILNRICPVCGRSGMYSEANYGEIGDVDVLTVSCCKCAHVEIYDVAKLVRIADAYNEKCIKEGLR